MRSLTSCFLLFLIVAQTAVAKNKKDVPLAPLPSQILAAKKVFLSNGGGNDLAYDAFYSAMKSWGKYEIVASPEEADIIAEIAYTVVHDGTRVWSSTNTYNGETQVHSAQVTDPQVILTIYDANSKNPLWSTVDHRRLARLQRNREKEIINSAERLVENLKQRAANSQ